VVAGLDEVRAEVSARLSAALVLIVTAVVLISTRHRSVVHSDGGAVADRDPRSSPGSIVDSILPLEEALRRFRVGLNSPAALDGPRTRNELFRKFVAGVRRKNRASLDSLAITRAEYAWLVFPELRISKPPYRQPPDIAWILADAASSGGLTKLLNRVDRFRIERYRCPGQWEEEGRLRVWRGCTVQVRDTAGVREIQLFGPIVERDGRFKFGGFSNDF